MRDIIGHGGGKGGGSSHTHYEAPDSLHSTSYARVLDLVSEGEILGLAEGLQSVYLNDTPLQNADGSSNFQDVTVDLRTGTQDQDYIPGFPDVESETAVGVELKYGTPWVRAINNTALSAIRITLGVDQLYKADTNNGDVGGSIVNYQVELSTDGGAYRVVLSNAFNGKTMSAYQRTARIDLPRATTGWQIRVSRLTPNSGVASIVDKTNLISFTEVIDAKLRYPMSAIVGIQVDAKQFQSVPTRAYDLFGRIIQVPSNYDPRTRTYSGTWDGTFKPSWSDNPAWVFRDLALHDRYGMGHRITPAQLDKWELYKIARYCDELVPDGKGGTEPRFTCNLYLQTRKQAYAVLQDIASIFRGISYWGAGTIIASSDMPADPVYVYTAANVIGGKFTRTGTKKGTRYTVALVTWNDPEDGYKQKVEYVEGHPDSIARYGIQQVDLTAFGCTSQGQAQRAGRWALATSRLETEGLTFDVGMDGAIARPGQIVRIADPSRMGRRVGGRVRAVAGRTVTLDKAPTVKAGDRLTVVLPSGTSETHAVASVAGDAVTVDADWSTLPIAQSVWSVDSDELSAPLFRVLSVAEKDEVTFTITAVQHEPGKFDFVEKGTAITPRPQTALDVTRQAPPASVALVGYTVSLADVQKLALQVSCAPVGGAVAYEGAYRRGNDNWVAIPRQADPTMDVLDVLAGTYTAKMWAVNSVGVTSIETMSVAVEIAADGASRNAKVDLSSDAPFFHTDQTSQTTPAVINFTADLTALDGPVSWSCVGGTLTNKTATTAQLAFADATASSVTVTASVTAFGRMYSRSLKVGKVQDGAAGTDGLKTAVARLFQWAPVAPAKPTGKSTFTWPGTNGGYDGADGWANPAPGNPGTPGWRLFSASVALQAAANATTTPVSYTNAVIEDGAQNGATGANGLQVRTVQVYQWAASIPAGPTGPATLKWSDGTFGVAPEHWLLSPGDAPSLGMTLFAASVHVSDTAANMTTNFNWQSAAVMAIGYAGTNGGPGAQGGSYVTAYCATTVGTGTSAPAPTKGKTSLPAANSGGLTGTYSASVPTLSAGQYQMQTDGIYDATTDMITWSIPYQSSLKVATLSALTANLGDINAGNINLGNGKIVLSNDGSAVLRKLTIIDDVTGKTILGAGGLQSGFEAPGTKNSELVPSISAAQASADAARAAIATISDDNVLSRSEKPAAVQAWNVCDLERASLAGQASVLGVDATPYIAAHEALSRYLLAINPYWADFTQDSPIVGSDWRANWNAYYDQKQKLINAMAAKASSTATGLSLSPDGKLVGPGGTQGQATLPGLGQNVFRVVAMGNYGGGSVPVSPGLYKNGGIVYGATRSYYVAMIRRSDGVIVQAVDFDVYGGGAVTGGRDAGTMANFLNAYGPDHIAVIWSHDEPMTNRMLPALVTAMYRCGASRNVFGSTQFKLRSAYVLIGVPGCGEGNGKEGYQGDVADDPNAWVDMTVTLINGAFTVSSGYSPRTLADFSYTGDYDATRGAPAGTYVAGNLAEQVNLWAQQGANAWNAIPGVNAAIADRISKASGGILQGPIALQTSGAISVGTASWVQGQGAGGTGIVISPAGIAGMKNGVGMFYVTADGDAGFGGSLLAASGSFGALRIAPGGYIAQGFGGTWNWADKASGPGFLIHPNGILMGDANDPSMGYIQMGADGSLSMPGFSYSGRQLTLTSPVIVNPNISSNFTVSAGADMFVTPPPRVTSRTLSPRTVSISGGKSPYSIRWTIDVGSGTWRSSGSTTDTVTLSVTSDSVGMPASAVITCTVVDASGLTKTSYFQADVNFN